MRMGVMMLPALGSRLSAIERLKAAWGAQPPEVAAEGREPRAESVLRTWAVLACIVVTACTRPPASTALAGAPVPVASDSIATTWARGSVRVDSFASPSLGATKRYLVYLPPSYSRETRRRYPVAYYLHGLYGDETNWVRLARLDRVADSIVAAGAREMIVVMPDGDDSWYTTWESPRTLEQCTSSTLREPAERYCVRSYRYDDYLVRDLVAHVDSTWRTRASPRNRAIAGLSMGGLGAINLAILHRDTYSAAASHSGVLGPLFISPRPFAEPLHYASDMKELEAGWGSAIFRTVLPAFGSELATWWKRDPAQLAREAKSRGMTLPALYADVGTEDNLVVNGNRAFRWELERAGVPLEYHEHPGAHSWTYWRAHVGESLRWLAERIAER